MILTIIAPSAISGGINFAVAYIMYRNMDLVRLWPFPNTIAGDLVVTTLIQGTINYVLFGATLSADIRRGSHVSWPLPPRPLTFPRSFTETFPLLFTPRPPSAHDVFDIVHFSRKVIISRLLTTIFKGFVCSLCLCLILFPVSIAILAPIYGGGRNMTGTYAPQIIKLVYGFVLSMIQTPIIAGIIMNSLAVEREGVLIVDAGDEKPSHPETQSGQMEHTGGSSLSHAHSSTFPSRGKVVGTYQQKSATLSFGAFPDLEEQESLRVRAPPDMRTLDKLFITITDH